MNDNLLFLFVYGLVRQFVFFICVAVLVSVAVLFQSVQLFQSVWLFKTVQLSLHVFSWPLCVKMHGCLELSKTIYN